MASFLLPMRTVHEINRVCINFLWNRLDCVTSHALIRSEDITCTYDKGDLGVRDLFTINKACLMRHIWNNVSEKNIFWAEWIQKNKIKNMDFWALQIPTNCSCSWRAIFEFN